MLPKHARLSPVSPEKVMRVEERRPELRAHGREWSEAAVINLKQSLQPSVRASKNKTKKLI